MYGMQLSQDEIKKIKIIFEKISEPVNGKVDIISTARLCTIKWTSSNHTDGETFMYLLKVKSDIGDFAKIESFIGPFNNHRLVKIAWIIAWRLYSYQEDEDKNYDSLLARNLWPEQPDGRHFPNHEKYEKILETLDN